MDLGERYRQLRLSLRDENNEPISTRDFAENFVKLTAPRVSELENNKREMSLTELKAYHKCFGVSFEYLLGETDTMTVNEDIQTACKVTGLSEKAVENLNNINILYTPIMIGVIDELICDFDHENEKGVLEDIFKYLLFDSQLLGKVNFEFKFIDDDALTLKLLKQELDNSKREILSGMIDKMLIGNIESDLNKIRSKILENFRGEI